MQHCVTEVAVGEGVGAVLEPDDNGVELTQGADSWMMDVEVDDHVGDAETEGCVDGVGYCNVSPG